MLLALAAIIACTAAGAWLYRLRGGKKLFGDFALPKAVEVGLWSLLLTLPALAAFGWWPEGWWECVLVALSLAGAYGGTVLGHGAYMDLGTSPEKPDHPTDPTIGGYTEEGQWAWVRRWKLLQRFRFIRNGEIQGSRRAFEMVMLGLTGMAATLAPGLALALSGEWAGLLLALAGFLKGPAYLACRLAWGRTDEAEWMFGACVGLAVGLTLTL